MRNNLKAIRKQRTKLTQQAAAEELNMNLETYRKWEQGKVNLTAAQLKTLAEFYECTIDEICGSFADSANSAIGRTVAFEDEIAELNVCYFNMSDSAREALMTMAHSLEELFPREQATK